MLIFVRGASFSITSCVTVDLLCFVALNLTVTVEQTLALGYETFIRVRNYILTLLNLTW